MAETAIKTRPKAAKRARAAASEVLAKPKKAPRVAKEMAKSLARPRRGTPGAPEAGQEVDLTETAAPPVSAAKRAGPAKSAKSPSGDLRGPSGDLPGQDDMFSSLTLALLEPDETTEPAEPSEPAEPAQRRITPAAPGITPERLQQVRQSMHLPLRSLARWADVAESSLRQMEKPRAEKGNRAIPVLFGAWIEKLGRWVEANPPPEKTR